MIDDEFFLIIRPTMSCNMRCKYCYNDEWGFNKNTLPVKDAYKFVDIAAQKHRCIWITFFGGEPTLLGVEYYREFYNMLQNIMDKYRTKFINVFQTNGLLLNTEWIGLFKMHDVMISVSYDGLHHSTLRGYADEIYQNLLLLRQNNCRFRIFCVETAATASQMLDNYKHFRDNGFNYKIIPVSPNGQAKNIVDLSTESKIIVNALIDVYKYWLTDRTRKNTMFTFREFLRLDRNDNISETYLRSRLALNFDSKVYPFGRPNDSNFQLGDLSANDINDYFETDKYKNLVALTNQEKEKRCTSCSSYNMCGGACIDGTFLYESSETSLDYACEQGRLIDEKVLAVNEQVKMNFEKGNFEKYADDVIEYFKH